jgi:hypothetical protein
MEQISCHRCPHAAKLVSATEAYYICFPKNQKSIDVHEKKAPDWCPILQQKEAASE